MPTATEKENLAAHVDLCEARFSRIDQDLNTLKAGQDKINGRFDKLEDGVADIVETLRKKENDAMKGLIKIAVSIIFVLIGALSFVIWYVITSGGA